MAAPKTADPVLIGKESGVASVVLQCLRRDFKSLSSAYESFDVDGDGTVTKAEFRKGLESLVLPVSDHALSSLCDMADVNGDDQIDYEEFLAALLNMTDGGSKLERTVTKAICRKFQTIENAFTKWDIDMDGILSLTDFTTHVKELCPALNEVEVEYLVSKCDPSGKGDIEFATFSTTFGTTGVEGGAGAGEDGKASGANGVAWADRDKSSPDGKAEKAESAEKARVAALVAKGVATAMNAQHGSLMLAFMDMDRTKSGKLSRLEIFKGISALKLGYTDSQIRALVDKVDLDGDGAVDYVEFVKEFDRASRTMGSGSAAIGAKSTSTTPVIRAGTLIRARYSNMVNAFKAFDSRGAGQLTAYDLYAGLCKMPGMHLTENEAGMLFKEIDADNSGSLELREFVLAFAPPKIRGRDGHSHSQLANHLVRKKAEKLREKVEEALKDRFHNPKQAFKAFDINGDGQLSVLEFHSGMVEMLDFSVTTDQVNSLISMIDIDNNATIDFVEFCKAFMPVTAGIVKKEPPRRSTILDSGTLFKKKTGNGSGGRFEPRKVGSLSQSPAAGAASGGSGSPTSPSMSPNQRLVRRVASHLRSEYLNDFDLAFDTIDANGDGIVDFIELRQGLKQSGLPISSTEITKLLQMGCQSEHNQTSSGTLPPESEKQISKIERDQFKVSRVDFVKMLSTRGKFKSPASPLPAAGANDSRLTFVSSLSASSTSPS